MAGHVRLASFPTATRGLVATALPPVLAAHPDLRISLTEREPWDTIDLVASGQTQITGGSDTLSVRRPGHPLYAPALEGLQSLVDALHR